MNGKMAARFYLPAGTRINRDYSITRNILPASDRLLLTSDTNFIPQGLGGTRAAKHELTGIGVYPFQSGNLVVVRIGDGGAPLTIGTAHKVFLDEYTKSGNAGAKRANARFLYWGRTNVLHFQFHPPIKRQVIAGLSPDGQFLALGGYDAAPGYASVVAAPCSAVKRVVSIVNAQGVINTSTVLDSFSATSIRSAVTNGYDIWAAGGNNGIRYTKLGDTNSIALVSQSGRSLKIFNEQLYASTTFSGFRIATVGTGLPRTAGQTMTNLPGIVTTSGSPYDIFLADLDNLVAGPDVMYVADEGNNGVSKYSLVGSSWVFNGKIGSSTDQYRGLTGKKTCCGVVLYATRKNSGSTAGGGEIVSIINAGGYNAAFGGTQVVLATAAPNTLIKGIAMSPGSQE